MAQSTNSQLTKFRYIKTGKGGTFYFSNKPSENENIPWIGTTECVTCVGVYLPINKETCFIALINGYVNDQKPQNSSTSQVSPSQGGEIEEEVYKRLFKHAKEFGWTPQNVKDSGKEVILVCPRLAAEDRAGRYVLNAIRRFLGYGQDEIEGCVRPEQQAFVVNHSSGEVHLIPAQSTEDLASCGWEMVHEDCARTFMWNIRVLEDQ